MVEKTVEITHTAWIHAMFMCQLHALCPSEEALPHSDQHPVFLLSLCLFHGQLTWRLCFHFALSIHWLPQIACGSQHLHHMHWES